MMYPVCSMESAEETQLCCIAFKPLLTLIIVLSSYFPLNGGGAV